MDKNVVLNEENENLKLQLKSWGIFLLAGAICSALGLGKYFPFIAIGGGMLLLTYKLYKFKKNKKAEAVK